MAYKAFKILLVTVVGSALLSGCSNLGHFTHGGMARQTVPLPAIMALGDQIPAPIGFLELCERSPMDCAAPEADPATVRASAQVAMADAFKSLVNHQGTQPLSINPSTEKDSDTGLGPYRAVLPTALTNSSAADYQRLALDPVVWALLTTVNRRVNASIIADTDQDIYHVPDYWQAANLAPGSRGDCEDFALAKRRVLIQEGISAQALSLAIVRTPFGEDHAVLVIATLSGDFVLDNLTNAVRLWQATGYVWLSRQAPGDGLQWVAVESPPAANTAGKRYW